MRGKQDLIQHGVLGGDSLSKHCRGQCMATEAQSKGKKHISIYLNGVLTDKVPQKMLRSLLFPHF